MSVCLTYFICLIYIAVRREGVCGIAQRRSTEDGRDVEDRREDRKLETNGPGPPKPDPAPVPRKVPGPIPWISTEPVSAVPPPPWPHISSGVWGHKRGRLDPSGSRCSSRGPLDGEDRLIPCEEEVLAIGSKKEN